MGTQTKCRGFTLIELLIVVAIIAILALIVVPNMVEAQARARVAREKNDLRMITLGIEAYRVDHNEYPAMVDRTGQYAYPCSMRFTWFTTPIAYITSVPQDPFITDVTAFDKGLLSLDADETWDTYGYARAYTTCAGTDWRNNSDYEDWWVFSHAWRLAGVGPLHMRRWIGDNPYLPPGIGQPASQFTIRIFACAIVA